MKRTFTCKLFALLLTLALLCGAGALAAEANGKDRAPTSVSLGRKTATLIVGQTLQLTARVHPTGAQTKLTWKSSKPSVAKVSKSGLVKALGEGTAKITVTTDNRKKATVTVTVKRIKIEDFDAARYRYFRKYMSDAEFRQAYDVAVKKVVAPLYGLPLEEQLYGIAQKLRQMFEEGMTYSMTDRHYNDPYGYFVLGKASCAGCTRATGFCLTILGIPYEHVNENQYSHQWARVKVGKTYWICDAYGLVCGPEPAPYQHPYF